MRTTALLALAVVSIAGRATAWNDILMVDDDGPADFTDVQSAVDAAGNGDAIVIRSGTYPGFTITNLGIRVLGDPAANVVIEGQIHVRNLTPARVVVLSDLTAEGGDGPGLRVTDNTGHLRVASCTFVGWKWLDGSTDGDAVLVENSSSVFFSRSVFRGERIAAGFGPAGAALRSIDSDVALYDCTLTGGVGYPGLASFALDGGEGGGAAFVDGGLLFASNTSFTAGDGGEGSLFDGGCLDATNGGDGGDGVSLANGAQLRLLDTLQLGGVEGVGGICGCFPNCANGVPGNPGAPLVDDGTAVVVTNYPGSAREMVMDHWITDSTAQVTFYGEPGDEVFLATKSITAFEPDEIVRGVWLPQTPAELPPEPTAVIPVGGSWTGDVPVDRLAGSLSSKIVFHQPLFISTGGTATLGTPNSTVVTECVGSVDFYCDGAPNSVGPGVSIGVSGSTSVSQNSLSLTGTGGPSNQFGIFFYGPDPTETAFGDGNLCIAGGFFRFEPPVQANGAGDFALAVDLTAPPANAGAGEIVAGSSFNFQLWYRDPAAGGAGFNLSGAATIGFCP